MPVESVITYKQIYYPDGTIKRVDPKCCKLWARPTDYFEGRHWLEFVNDGCERRRLMGLVKHVKNDYTGADCDHMFSIGSRTLRHPTKGHIKYKTAMMPIYKNGRLYEIKTSDTIFDSEFSTNVR